jgi:hypothetical protein
VAWDDFYTNKSEFGPVVNITLDTHEQGGKINFWLGTGHNYPNLGGEKKLESGGT